MTPQEAIPILERLQEPEAWEPQISRDAYEALEMAIEALEKDIPKKPKLMENIYPKQWGCPNCGFSVTSVIDYQAGAFGTMSRTVVNPRCMSCGQAIYWE